MNTESLLHKRFFGRKRELSELSEILMSSLCSVLTVTGIGGVGKTSTALKLASGLRDRFQRGMCFVPLADLEHSGQVAAVIASAMGLKISGGSAARQLPGILADKDILLVLDNFEHLTGASVLIEEIGLQAKKAKILVTSRTRLNIAGEVTYELSGMTIPINDSPEALLSSAPVRLFLSNPEVDGKLDLDDMKTVVQICVEVKGVPLGIVLASSWMTEMSISEILDEVSGKGQLLHRETAHKQRRHSSLRRVFDYSWMLLSKQERILFAEISVFRGSFDEDAVEQITGRSRATLRGLWHKSLIQMDTRGRLSLHKLLHAFSSGKLSSQPARKKQLIEKHADYYCRLMETNQKAIIGGDSAKAMELLTANLSEIREALSCALDMNMTESFISASTTIRSYFLRTGFLEEGRETFMRASSELRGISNESFLKLKLNQADFAIELARYDEAAFLLEAILAENAGELFGYASISSGMVYLRTGNLERAESRMNTALRWARSEENRDLEARALASLGDLFNHKLDAAKAKYFMMQAVEINTEAGNVRRLLSNWVTLSNLEANFGRGSESLEYAQKALDCSNKLKGDLYIALAQISIAEALSVMGDYRQALNHAEVSVKLFEEIDSRWGLQSATRTLAIIQTGLGLLEKGVKTIQRSIAISESIGGTYNSMESFITGGDLYQQAGNTSEAVIYYDKARRIAKHLNIAKILKELDEKISELTD